MEVRGSKKNAKFVIDIIEKARERSRAWLAKKAQEKNDRSTQNQPHAENRESETIS